MMTLYGTDVCTSCRQAREALGRTPLEWTYVDVSKIPFEGEIPHLKIEDGSVLIGLGQIMQFIRSQGFK